MISEKTILGLLGMMCVEFNIAEPARQEIVMSWIVEACEAASIDPDKEFELRDNKNNIAQMHWMLFMYKIYKYVGVKHFTYKNRIDMAKMIEREYEYKIFTLSVRLGIKR